VERCSGRIWRPVRAPTRRVAARRSWSRMTDSTRRPDGARWSWCRWPPRLELDAARRRSRW